MSPQDIRYLLATCNGVGPFTLLGQIGFSGFRSRVVFTVLPPEEILSLRSPLPVGASAGYSSRSARFDIQVLYRDSDGLASLLLQ